MTTEPAELMRRQAAAHAAAEAEDIARLRSMSLDERRKLIEDVCEAAAIVYDSRLAGGLPDVKRDPWPASTWEFLRKHAARVRERAKG